MIADGSARRALLAALRAHGDGAVVLDVVGEDDVRRTSVEGTFDLAAVAAEMADAMDLGPKPEEAMVEAAAEAIWDHWQNAPGPHARPWAETVAKLPAAAEDFRRMGRGASRVVLRLAGEHIDGTDARAVEAVAKAIHDRWGHVDWPGRPSWDETVADRPALAADYRSKAVAVVAATAGFAPRRPRDGEFAVVRRDDGRGFLCRWNAAGTSWGKDGQLVETGVWTAVVSDGWFQPDEVHALEPLADPGDVETVLMDEIAREVSERVEARLRAERPEGPAAVGAARP